MTSLLQNFLKVNSLVFESNTLRLLNNSAFSCFSEVQHYRSLRSFTSMESTAPGPIQQTIQTNLEKTFNPSFLEVVNESYKHSVPKGSESHFKVVIVSDSFEGQSLIQRHRSVNSALATEISGKIHALSIQAKTPAQWEASGHAIANTPRCLGGSKFERK